MPNSPFRRILAVDIRAAFDIPYAPRWRTLTEGLMSEQAKNVENLRTIREMLVKRRRDKAQIAAGSDALGNIDALIEIQQKIEVIDRAISDEVTKFDPEAWKKLA